ncbi:MAG: glutaminase A [Clostridium sp.]
MVQSILEQAMEAGREEIPLGEVASYIPELGHADKNHLGICILTKDGEIYEAGDTMVRFTIQSISKVISLAAALQHCGFEKVFEKIGMEPSGDAFNSLLKLDMSSDYPCNPMINSGAIAVASYLSPVVSFEEMLEYAKKLCMDPDIVLDEKIYHSEMTHSARNRAIAYLLESKGIIESDVEKSLELYVKMCSLSITARSLAGLGLVLANGGIHPKTGERLLDSNVVRAVKTIMLTCGMYDGSGEFAVHVGMPSKSGVGGGILSVVDKKMGIGIYGPALDEKGNSIAGRYMLKYLSDMLHLHMFADENQ